MGVFGGLSSAVKSVAGSFGGGGALSFLNPTAALTAGTIGLNAIGSVYQAKQNQASAKDQMRFQREMSNTSYRRQMDDLRKAGLNPILAAKIGGASTPQGAGYQTPNIGAAATQGAHSAMQTANLYQQNQVLQKQATAAGIENNFLLKEPWAVPAKMLQGMSPLEIAAFKTWWETTQKNDAKSGATAYGTKINQYDNSKNQAGKWEDIRYGGSRTGSKKNNELSKEENDQINDAWKLGDVYNATEWW